MPHRTTPHTPPRRDGVRIDRILATRKRTVRARAPTAAGAIAADGPHVVVARRR